VGGYGDNYDMRPASNNTNAQIGRGNFKRIMGRLMSEAAATDKLKIPNLYPG